MRLSGAETGLRRRRPPGILGRGRLLAAVVRLTSPLASRPAPPRPLSRSDAHRLRRHAGGALREADILEVDGVRLVDDALFVLQRDRHLVALAGRRRGLSLGRGARGLLGLALAERDRAFSGRAGGDERGERLPSSTRPT